MLFYLLFIVNTGLIFLYIKHVLSHKTKNYRLSIVIRILTLLLFALVIFEQFSEKQHLILVLLTWIIFEGLDQYHKPTIKTQE
jgi:hypothetical protein